MGAPEPVGLVEIAERLDMTRGAVDMPTLADGRP